MKKEEKRCTKKVHRSDEEIKVSVQRLNRIEGQIRGISKMISDDRHCDDILIQVSAVISALKSFGDELLLHHMKTCMVSDIKNDKLETIDEVMELSRRLK